MQTEKKSKVRALDTLFSVNRKQCYEEEEKKQKKPTKQKKTPKQHKTKTPTSVVSILQHLTYLIGDLDQMSINSPT